VQNDSWIIPVLREYE